MVEDRIARGTAPERVIIDEKRVETATAAEPVEAEVALNAEIEEKVEAGCPDE